MIDMNKPMIFTGGVSATVVLTVMNHFFGKTGKVFEYSYASWEVWI